MSVTETIIAAAAKVLAGVFGSANERQLKRLWPLVERVKTFYPMAQALPDEDFPGKTDELRRRYVQGESADSLLFEAFALCREASHRTLGEKRIVWDKWIEQEIRHMGHFDVQILGGIVLHESKIAEMVTGEGKTLVATLPAYLNGLVPSDRWIEASKAVQGPDVGNWVFEPFARRAGRDPWELASALSGEEFPNDFSSLLPVGRGVHVITVNDYLAKRDCEWNRPLFEFLGLTVGAIQADMENRERIPQYFCDITYGTNNEFGFDYLRDNLKVHAADQVQRSRCFAIIDEVDSILIDEARTPLIISGSAEQATDRYYTADRVARKLSSRHQNDVDETLLSLMRKGWDREEARMKAEEGVDFVYSERDHSAKLTEQGQNRVLQLLGIRDLYSGDNLDWLHYMDNALRANTLYGRDHHYVVKDGQVVIVDEFTGRLMEGRRWSDGLHQAVEAKEHLRIKEESQTVATITFQNFFKLYEKLSGMTGTAMTEAKEFLSIYGLEPVSIPTNRPLLRKNWSDLVYGTEKEKYTALVEHVAEVHAMGRPLLVGTVSIARSELLSELLKRRGIEHEVLNAKHHAREAQIVAQAGQFGRVTIATNMAGRGTDIVLGRIELPALLEHWKRWRLAPKEARPDLPREALERFCLESWVKYWIDPEEPFDSRPPEAWRALLETRWAEHGLHPPSHAQSVADLGGLHVVGTERHEARRIDNQLRGRCARQGDPGSSRFFLSLDDDIMRIFAPDRVKNILRKIGLSDGMPLEHPMVNRSIERAQRKVEERNFEIRKNLLEYDSVMNEQRFIIYDRRQAWLEGRDLRETVFDYLRDALERQVQALTPPETRAADRDLLALAVFLKDAFLLEVPVKELEALYEAKADVTAALFERLAAAYEAKEAAIGPENHRELEKFLLLQTLDRKWMDHLYAMDLLKEGIHLRSYGGQDPKLIYKREGYEMFEELWASHQEEVTSLIMKIRPVREEAPALRQAVDIGETIHDSFGAYEDAAQSAGAGIGERHAVTIKREEKKISRNAPCPCGSGLKYKKCCGRK
ncbi:MAG: preprotein translocase subunit SecA [Planctomycetota bacterium]